MKNAIKKFLHKMGFDIIRFPNHLTRTKLRVLHDNKINLILDVGANMGQFAQETRKYYQGRIVSFEPLSKAFAHLSAAAANDRKWEIHNIAMGDVEEKVEINVSENLVSSSILEILPEHVDNGATLKTVTKETIKVTTLDKFFEPSWKGQNILLKIDTQGYEQKVLLGALNNLPNIKVIQLEMSILPIYNNEVLYVEMIQFMKTQNFELYFLEPGYVDPVTGQLLQIDGIFIRK